MKTLAISAQGQIALDKELLDHLGVQPGQELVVELLSEGRLALEAARPAKISDVFGFLQGKTARSLSIAEINETAARGWAGQNRK